MILRAQLLILFADHEETFTYKNHTHALTTNTTIQSFPAPT